MTNPWPAILRRPPADLVLVHELGLPDDPSSIYGRETLSARPDGSLTLRWLRADQSGAVAANVEPKIVQRWAALLAAAGFPEFPTRPLTPGASFRKFEVQSPAENVRAMLSRFHFEETAPYEELCAIVDSLGAQMRGRKCYADPDPAAGLVRDVHPIE